MSGESVVKEFFSKKNIFITGATGFVGVTLLEKILRSVPDVGTIYLLIREKKGKTIQERLDEIKTVSVFDRMKEEMTNEEFDKVFTKAKAIAGDVGEPNLAMSPSDRQLLCDEVNIVFHSAASLDFEETLRTTTKINLLGTRQIAELCAKINKLDCLVHVSSAYVNSYLLHAEEKIYPLMADPEAIIKFVEDTPDDAELIEKTPDLLGTHPNTYTFTKHMAEHEVKKFETTYPVAIVRPSMICGAWKEPIPGWTISKNGPQGFVMGALMGVVRRLPMSSTVICDYIPVDLVVNTLLVAAVHAGTFKPNQVEIYQATSSVRKPFRWQLVENKINGYLHRYPSKSAVWYPHLKLLPSYQWFKISAFFVHILPALVLDGILKLTGGRAKLSKLHRNINRSLELLHKFIFTEWTYTAEKTESLHTWLSLNDKDEFGVSLAMLDWRDYFLNLCHGVRRYLCKEKDSSLPAAKNKDLFLRVLHLTFKGLIYVSFWYTVMFVFGATWQNSMFILPLLYFTLNLL